MSRKLVNKVLRDDCDFAFPETVSSLPFSILIASCIARMMSCILGLEDERCSTHWIATSAILHTDSIFAFSATEGSTMLFTSLLQIIDLAYILLNSNDSTTLHPQNQQTIPMEKENQTTLEEK